ncbi:SusD/RagB family nutrient-binding outer membrane lipoprotein [Allomuricauda taeanensis]|uniref:SusD/RagB family nutrient-binding outer membrane lipoprotein n=1 Tax=Flagellimonas taeanensis TaxID=1005926 RepID=UPI002E7BBB7F|nr:SusD/RagB family nutrient-binding outer membrane lipoprotein [Allomuricauda taeanensis]MEE1963793.1 SusD/RagB family nutrient-binding outer membrane lipoprotein [Allomuricauda taeanensis]
MKNIYIKSLLALFFIGIASCETVELDLTESPNQVSVDNLDPDYLFNNVQLSFANFVESSAGAASFSAALSRQFAMTGGNTYDNAYTPISFDGLWNSAYAQVLIDIEALEPIATELGLNYHLGVSKVFKAYTYFTLVDIFGDVPYSEALLGNENLNPSPDDQIEIYKAMLTELDEAISILNSPSPDYPLEDFYFSEGGTVDDGTQESWITAAKTLKLRVLNNARLAGADLGVNITTTINSLISGGDLIDQPEEDWVLQYGSNRTNPGTRHPGYYRYYEASAAGYMSNYLMWEMISEKGFDDPRLTYYFYRQDTNATNENVFTLGCLGATAPAHYSNFVSVYDQATPVPFCVASAPRGYWGRDHGDNSGIPPDDEKRTVFGLYPAGGKYDDGSGESTQEEGTLGQLGAGITPLITSFFVDFILAESALTSGTNGDPRVYLEDAIRGSMDKVIGFLGVDGDATGTDVDNYVAFVLDAYDNAANDSERLEIIIKEYHIASFGNGLEAYNAYRRTGFPSNLQPTLIPNSGTFYNSAIYSSNFVNLNSNATQKNRSERIFWDKNSLDLQ